MTGLLLLMLEAYYWNVSLLLLPKKQLERQDSFLRGWRKSDNPLPLKYMPFLSQHVQRPCSAMGITRLVLSTRNDLTKNMKSKINSYFPWGIACGKTCVLKYCWESWSCFDHLQNMFVKTLCSSSIGSQPYRLLKIWRYETARQCCVG